MEEIADNVFKLAGRPAHAFNSYLVGDVLVDARTRHASRRILGQLKGRALSAHLITHAHADHQGSSAAVCKVPMCRPASEGQVVALTRGGPGDWVIPCRGCISRSCASRSPTS